MVSELIERGHDVSILTGLPNYPEGKVFQSYIENPKFYSAYNGAQVIRVPMVSRGNNKIKLALNYFTFAISASIFGAWRLRGRRYDAIFTYEPSPITVGLPAVLLRALKNVPLVFWVLDLWPETLEAIGVVRHKVILFFIRKLVSFIYKRCDVILAQSKSFIPQIRKYAGDNTCIEYFPSWAEKFQQPVNRFSIENLGIKAKKFNIIFTGNIGEAQDFPSILAAAEILRDRSEVRWLIIGSGRMYGWLVDQIKSRNLEGCIFLFGQHPLEAMPLFFDQADALLVSLKDEPIFALTIPAKLQSYLSAGKPILGMLNGEGAKVIIDSGSGLSISSGDALGLANSVLKLLSMTSEERAEMGQKGIEFSIKEFNKEKLITALEVLLKRPKVKLDW
ncbi:glycosyltransferase family 4 protein [Polynucleobacter sp. AP-Feld-500C-C5]|uniref:glycosyltransferase family 4 protein n=1 Tax=Polynucleobacter sp. AP-Feld-500C-C5 TaxID=2576924 RepID=UPI002104A759|nr:glycosyltransferase family 4 protein [Polynucleobacter sp. AP-Feld-500C-C5]